MNNTGSVADAVGNTPLIRIHSLSEITGCNIFGKAEFLNPGGSIKDRAAKGIIGRAEKEGKLTKGGIIVEGTAGNTGIGLATLAPERGYRVIISMPDDQAAEKYQVLEALGAEIRAVPRCPFKDENHFYHRAKKIAEATPGAIWANQFENTANAQMHFDTTGPEIWQQLQGEVDILTCAVGTGGTMGGVSAYLKQQNPQLTVIAADPPGSGVHDYLKTGTFSGSGGSITEGIGIMRMTDNLNRAMIDDGLRVDDRQTMAMLFHLAEKDGLFLGTSSGLNLFAAYQLGKKYQNQGKNIVTFLCDHGSRYASKLLDPAWLAEKSFEPKPRLNP